MAIKAATNPIAGPRNRTIPFTAWLLIAGIALAALNLRTAVTSIGAVLEEVQTGLGMSPIAAGLLTTLPVLAFAGFGITAPALIRRWGHRYVISIALVIMSIGLFARSVAEGPVTFLIFSAVALSFGAIGNVAIPGVIKKHFPDRIGALMMVYSAALALGTTVSAAGTVPFAELFGSWRPAIAVWAIPALLAIIPWMWWKDTSGGHEDSPSTARSVSSLWRSKLARNMMLFFGLQSAFAYIMFGWLPQILRDNGFTPAEAGFLFGYLTFMSVPIYMVIPMLASRTRDQRLLYYFIIAALPIGLAGLWAGPPGWLTLVWLTLIVVGMGSFPLCLTLFGLRARTHEGTAALSAFSQSGGYLISGLGPFVVGVLYSVTGGWNAPMIFMFALIVIFSIVGRHIVRDIYVEDELDRPVEKKAATT
ncbi:CynX/NimT family MFS transporter [Natronoglycomyces albus]|uniref:MFS transporter n=1 Tax=Natronoglycomyces albus TaxID=2811108 RepID=A0A895XTL3_9ACTN|nr:MFS transporter [Natronoglycomyces albus]QSB04978.1 MFS transporter [Natronoglycomyces albus]